MQEEETEVCLRVRGWALMAIGKPKVGYVFRMENKEIHKHIDYLRAEGAYQQPLFLRSNSANPCGIRCRSALGRSVGR